MITTVPERGAIPSNTSAMIHQVTSYTLNLHEIDTVRSSSGLVTSAIEIMCRKGNIKILSDPLVSSLIATKSTRFANVHFLVHCSLYVSLVLVQTFLVWLHCSAGQWNKVSRMALEIVSVIMACLFLTLEALDVGKWTMQVYHRRALIRAKSIYSPPLYPIPGECQVMRLSSEAKQRPALFRAFLLLLSLFIWRC